MRCVCNDEKTPVVDHLLKALIDSAKLPQEYADLANVVLAGQQAAQGGDTPLAELTLLSGNGYRLASALKLDDAGTDELLSLQRVVMLTQDPTEVGFLLKRNADDVNLDGAWKIRMLGQTRFGKAYVAALSAPGSDPAVLQGKADELFKRAAERCEATAHAFGEARALATAQHVDALCSSGDRDLLQQRIAKTLTPADGDSRLPSWEMLFGSLDACACDECDSIFGPASYLVDVLQYFKRLDRSDESATKVTGGKDGEKPPCLAAPAEALSVFDVLMARRPDIGYLDLNCANAVTQVPYIDLVNELLEDAVGENRPVLTMQLEPGPIPEVALEKLHSGGFLEVTDKAKVIADSLDNRLVRDERALILFERNGSSQGCPVWLVKQLRQTYGSEREIGAAPEYVNQTAVNNLKDSHFALALPFDADRVEAVAYLARMGTDRATAMRALIKGSKIGGEPADRLKMAMEALGLTTVELNLITRPAPNEQHKFWADKPDTVVQHMAQLRHFLDKTGLKTEPVDKSQLEELLAGRFVSPCGKALSIVPDGPTKPDAHCDTEKMKIGGLDNSALDRINRFLRLWRKLGWPINLLDRLIVSPAVGKGLLNKACIENLSDIVRLASELNMEPPKVAEWFVDISVFGEHSDYRRIFLQKDDSGHSYQPFLIEALCPSPDCMPADATAADWPDLKDHKTRVTAALGIAADQLDALLAYRGNEPGATTPAKLSLSNLSRIWAWFRLSKKLGLNMQDLIALLGLIGIKDALECPETTRAVCEAAALLKKWRINVADLRFWLLHKTQNDEEAKKRIIPDLAIARLLGELRKALRAIGDARTAKEITIADPKPTPPVPGDGMTTCLEKVGFVLSQISVFTAENARQFVNLLQQHDSKEAVAALKTLLTDGPLGQIANVSQLADKSPVNELGSWIESDDKKTDNHSKYQEWTSLFVHALLDYIDQLARNEAAIRLVSQAFRAPVEEIDAILEWCRMPANGAPAKGDALIAVFASPNWASDPAKEVTSPEEKKAITALLDGALCATEEDVAKLEERPRLFRNAVLAGTSLAAWTPPPAQAFVDTWQKAYSQLFVAVRLAHKIAGLTKALKLQTQEQLAWGLWRELRAPGDPRGQADNRFQQLGWFSPDEMPLTALADDTTPDYSKWALLLQGLDLIAQYPLTETPSDPDVKLGTSTALALSITDAKPDSIGDIVAVCYQLFGLPDVDLFKVAAWLGLKRPDFKFPKTYARIERAAEVIRKLGIAFADLPALTAETVTRELALILRQCLKQQSEDADWLDTLKEIQDPIREQKRDALVAYLIGDPDHLCFREVNDLYDHFLIDTQMCACMPTSRIVQAHAVVQLFAQRCLMGQEPSVDPRADDSHGGDWDEWPWMRNYRVWQANRKVFLYPENWIEPQSRDDKSQFFKELEQTLLQTEVNDVNVEVAARTYLDKLDDAAFMEVMAVHYQDTTFSENGKSEGRVLHVVARTKGGDPPAYYYRRFVNEKSWTPWEKIDLDIATDHVLLFVRNNRLNIAWPIFADVIDESAVLDVPSPGAKDQRLLTAPRGWTIQLALSERSNGLWQPKRVSKDAIRSTELVKATNDQMMAERKRCRFVIRDLEPRQRYFVDEEGTEITGFFILAYSFIKSNEKGELVSVSSLAEPTVIGAFNLAGCRGYPEIVLPDTLGKIGAERAVSIPRINDVAFETQRWIEQGADADNDLIVQGLIGNDFAPTSVLTLTPGTFKVTTTQQTTVVDDVLMNVLKILDEEPSRWRLSGIMVPFFYEDGRRGYVALPTLRFHKDEESNELIESTISDLVADLEYLQSDIKTAAKDGEKWEVLVKKWKDDPRKKAAFESLTAKLKGCFGLNFLPFYHPFVCMMKRCLSAGGFEQLMNASPLRWERKDKEGKPTNEFDRLFKPEPIVLRPLPEETTGFEFDRNDGYANYNWEVFYHLPSLVSQKLVLGQKFEDALRWFHFVFNPTGIKLPPEGYGEDAAMPAAPKGVGRYWITKPFRNRSDANNPYDKTTYVGQRIETILRLLADPAHPVIGKEWRDAVDGWRKNPFVPHQVARTRTVAFQKATFMHYLDALIQWGDFLFRQDDREDVNAALQLYITAERLLGPRPKVMKAPGKAQSRTYRELEGKDKNGIDAFGNSLVELENLLPQQPAARGQDNTCMPALPAGALLTEPYFCIPRNDKLMGYWDTVSDRLYKIRHCQNIEGVERQLALFAPPIDPALLVRAVAAGLSIGSVLAQGAGEVPHYRFNVLAQKAAELAQMVITVGNALLQAIEKKDAEALAQLRSNQEISLLKLVRQIKLNEVEEALQTQASLERTRATTEARRNFYRDIKYTIGTEEKALDLNEQGARLGTAGLVFSTAANISYLVPTFKFGAWGFGGGPGADAAWGGVNLGNAAGAMGQFLGGMGGLQREAAGALTTRAGYERRWDDWKLQERLADRELDQIDRQIVAAEIRVQIAKDELTNHDKQTEQAAEVLAYLKDRKFSNQDLYDWMVGQISATYFQSWQMAYRSALRVERAFHFELGPNDQGQFVSYVRPDNWDSLHKGLLAGDRLMFDLKRMETDYLDRNRRELEITKHVSLVRLSPEAFLNLKKNGRCEVSLDELLFDLDYPGHYFRRIKSVSLSIPCVAGPYSSVNCTLTLTKSQIRKSQKIAEGEEDEDNLLRNYARIQSIATSTGQNDSGMFEVNFRDERYLPFEGAGAASTWTLELMPQDNRQLDYNTLTDVILHVKYTARQGSKQFREKRRIDIDNQLKDQPVVHRLFVLPDEFPSEWHRFINQKKDDGKNRTLTLESVKDRLPYFSPGLSEDAARVSIVSLEHGSSGPKFFFKQSKPEESATEWEGVTFGKWEFSCPEDNIPKLGLLVSVAESSKS
ncbi:hypothetical protein ACVIYH_004861 [Bradyrhizobium diazoefficiens]